MSTDYIYPNPITLASASGNTAGTPAVEVRNAGPASFQVFGTFGGCTAKLQASLDGTNWVDVAGASLAAAGHVQIATLVAMYVRAVISGGTSNSVTVMFMKGWTV